MTNMVYWKQPAVEGEKGKPHTSLSKTFLPLTDQSDRCAVLQGWNGRPLPCAFLSSAVADLGQQVCTIRVLVFKDVSRDLDQEGVQLCLVPVVESLSVSVSWNIVSRIVLFPPIWLYRTGMTQKILMKMTSYSSPVPSHRGPYPEHPSSGDRPHKSAACRHTQCHYGPFSQNAPRPHLRPAGAG